MDWRKQAVDATMALKEEVKGYAYEQSHAIGPVNYWIVANWLAGLLAAAHREGESEGRAAAAAQLKACQALLFRLFDEGALDVHLHGCPEDDTCSCAEAVELRACLKGMP